MTNLMMNAIQACDEGDEITVEVGRVDDDGEPLAFVAVADTGPGISEDMQVQLFDPFFTTKDVGEGTGLGLSLAKAAVEAHGGQIAASSGPARGATITVRLPAALVSGA